jgi:peptidoglycan hydrolase-like protein with peptidoglycan-binding domain
MAKKQDTIIPYLLLGIGAYFLFKKTPTVPVTVPSTSIRPTTTNRATTGSVTPSGSFYVKWYQAALNQLMGYNLAIDGIIGPETQDAVINFQQMWGLTIDGIVGPETDYYLNTALGTPGYTDKPYTP